MDKKHKDRNVPAEKGRNNDPDIRDDSAVQPGVNTISESKDDDENQHLTETAKDDFRTIDDNDNTADKKYDE